MGSTRLGVARRASPQRGGTQIGSVFISVVLWRFLKLTHYRKTGGGSRAAADPESGGFTPADASE
jgi:hypothetical protein